MAAIAEASRPWRPAPARVLGSADPLWYGNLGREIAANLAGDVATQVATLSLWYWHVRSNWLLVVFAIRWVVIAGVAAGEWFRRKRRRDHAMLALIIGHGVGIMATPLIIPEVVPLVLLVLVSDLLLVVRYERRRSLRLWIALAALAAGWVGLAGQQHGARLGEQTPRALYFAFLVGVPAVSGAMTGVATAGSRRELLANTAELVRSRRRLALAGLEQRQVIAHELRAGPLAALDRLAGTIERVATLHTVGDVARTGAAAEGAVQEAQAVAAQLRELSHGIFPEALRQHGLRSALAVLAQRVAVPIEVANPIPPLDEATATTVYFTCAATASWCRRPSSFRVSVRTDDHATRLRIDLAGSDPADPGNLEIGSPDELMGVLSDRLRVVEGAIRISRSADGVTVDLHLPAQSLAVPRFAAPAPDRQARRPTSLRTMGPLVGATYGAVLLIVVLMPHLLPVAALLSTVPVLAILPFVSARAVTLAIAVQTMLGGTLAAFGGYVLVYQSDPAENWSAPPFLILAPVAAALVTIWIGRLLGIAHAQLVERAIELQRSEARLVASADEERRRIERDLHDGGQQQCVAVAIQLRAATRTIDDPVRFDRLLGGVRELIAATRADLEQLVSGSAPVEPGVGLGPALSRALAAHPRIVLDDRLTVAADPDTVSAAYFCCLESVQNALKHAGSRETVTITVTLRQSDHQLVFEVADDGVGFDPGAITAGHGIQSLTERLEAFGGELRLVSSPGAGTRVIGELPLAGALLSAGARR